MNDKEIGEIRRHLRRDRSNITKIYGCFVNDNKEIITEFSQSTGIMLENEGDKYFALFKRVLSGAIGKNLIDITFKTSQVANSPEHKLLMDLRASKLADDELLHGFFQKIIDSVVMEGNYLILMGCDSYDVPFKGKDDLSDSDKSEEVYTYIVCAICPVKQTKPNLHYVPEEKLFHDGAMNQPVSAPVLGFLFPAFDNRATNIYNALYYTHDIKVSQDALIEALFNTPVPMPAAEQKKCFESLLTTALGEECNLDVVQTVHDQLCQRIELHKEAKVPEPLMIAKADVKEALASCGVSEEHLAKFSVDYDETFGFEADLHPKNIIDSKRFEIKTPDVSIKVDPTRSDLIETRVIGGVKYIMICADENVEVNGVSIHIDEEKKEPAQV
ncbi:DUF4317 domain-containing protein [Pseudoflavonifractor sp. MSJ-30]|uniref:DUF4317 domain-containing protein n=1 Tax=Pseudoflavonifractor sp. MSJ-30 TaxID=2841525 RepID=UPI001C120665|nr:DUF4317 domain-containing protein [Pseudoflavonifractor sp. MSJ-30]MBU5453231.1 DUF4317 domain-containing protein [Pseudoflavonifractor sp. MSJ-30]